MTDCTVGQVLAFVGGGVGDGGLGGGVGDEPVGGAGVGLLAVGVAGVEVLGLSPQPVSRDTIVNRAKESGAKRRTRISTNHLKFGISGYLEGLSQERDVINPRRLLSFQFTPEEQ